MPYADATELARLLKIRVPDAGQTAQLERVLIVAMVEIDAEIDLAEGVELTDDQLELAAEVNLERAQEHWQASPFGLIGLGGELGSAFVSRDSWERYALKLAPIKNQWGLA